MKYEFFAETYGIIPELLDYISKTWIKHKELFVVAWTNNYSHFGTVNTSRCEGLYGVL